MIFNGWKIAIKSIPDQTLIDLILNNWSSLISVGINSVRRVSIHIKISIILLNSFIHRNQITEYTPFFQITPTSRLLKFNYWISNCLENIDNDFCFPIIRWEIVRKIFTIPFVFHKPIHWIPITSLLETWLILMCCEKIFHWL